MGAIVGAGWPPDERPTRSRRPARRTPLYRTSSAAARLALFDPRPLLERMATDLGDPRIEELPVPLGITTYDLVAGRPRLITRGPPGRCARDEHRGPALLPAAPRRGGCLVRRRSVGGRARSAWPVHGRRTCRSSASWPTSRSRPSSPARWSAALLRAASARLGVGTPADRLTARRYLALLDRALGRPGRRRAAGPAHCPSAGRMNALQFGRVAGPSAIGERDAVWHSLPSGLGMTGEVADAA